MKPVNIAIVYDYSNICLKGPLKKNTKLVFNTDYCLMNVKNIAECCEGSILQYFRPSLSNQFPLRPLFYLILSGRLRHKKIIICPREGEGGTPDALLDYFPLQLSFPYAERNFPLLSIVPVHFRLKGCSVVFFIFIQF